MGAHRGPSMRPRPPMFELMRDALPEFLGSLGATLAVAGAARAISRLRKRRDAGPTLTPPGESRERLQQEESL